MDNNIPPLASWTSLFSQHVNFPWNDNRWNIWLITVEWFYNHVKTLLPGGKTCVPQKTKKTQHPDTQTLHPPSKRLVHCSDATITVQAILDFSQTYLWHLIKRHFPLLGSSIFYKQKNVIKVKLNITCILWGKHLGTRFLCPENIHCRSTWNKQTTKLLLDVHLMTNLQGEINTWLIIGKFSTHWFRLCQCRVLLVWRYQAHLVLALTPGSHTGRCLYEGLLCPAEMTNGKILINHWLMTTHYQDSSCHYSPICYIAQPWCVCHLHSFQNPDGAGEVI